MRFKPLLLSLSFFISSSIFAVPMSSTIPLDEVTITPGKIGYISFSKLFVDVPYEVTCTVSSNANNPVKSKDVMFYTMYDPAALPVSINHDNVSYQSVQTIQLNQSIIRVKHIKNDRSFGIRNLDYTDNLITSCFASPEKN